MQPRPNFVGTDAPRRRVDCALFVAADNRLGTQETNGIVSEMDPSPLIEAVPVRGA